MTFSDHSMCIIRHQGIMSPRFSLFLISLLVELRVGDEEKAYLHCIFCKVKNRIQRRKQVIQSDQDVHVCGFLDGTRAPLCMTLSFILRYELSSFFFSSLPSFPFFYASEHGYTFFSPSFFYSSYFFAWWIWRIMSKGWSIFGWTGGMSLRNFQCRS